MAPVDHAAALHRIKVDLAHARRKLNKVLADSEGVNFTGEQREMLVDSLGMLRAQLDTLADHFQPHREDER